MHHLPKYSSTNTFEKYSNTFTNTFEIYLNTFMNIFEKYSNTLINTIYPDYFFTMACNTCILRGVLHCPSLFYISMCF